MILSLPLSTLTMVIGGRRALVPAVAVAALSLLLLIGAAAPAVWSRRPARREAALHVLNSLLGREHQPRRR
ncbi:hypothetical protein QMK19_27250 [Streptomyces sp. H10-C2]|uniref:hypothetical protein n=1 Tax=unclassified Streptomyces TaxID=2593676 RepID=UPI0024B961C4|nr:MULTISPECIES: hypothetical protein [unclassified Streptomyces]MDJ0343731.1 hypothetical protein [Streptomyces sp. PH10-H1]MDJ0373252.1 hypothetical protein [Streptomyces sp. H10-C2]